jgi:hypothetical protein
MVDSSFLDSIKRMSFGELREYIDSCLSRFSSKPSNTANPVRTKKEFLQL